VQIPRLAALARDDTGSLCSLGMTAWLTGANGAGLEVLSSKEVLP